MDSALFTRQRLAFLIGVPLAWAVLLMFHGSGDRDAIYEGLRDEVTTWQIVHAGTLLFIGLMGLALYLLVRDLPGRAAAISRAAIGPFVLFYGAWEAVIGLATGALVQHANEVPAADRPAVSEAIQSLQDNVIVGDPGVLLALGGFAWLTAVIAAALALRHAGAPRTVEALLVLSAVVVSHPPPIGPVALVCFAAAVGLLAFSRRRATVQPPGPAPVIGAKL